MGLVKSDLLGVTMAVIHVAGQGSIVSILETIKVIVAKKGYYPSGHPQ